MHVNIHNKVNGVMKNSRKLKILCKEKDARDIIRNDPTSGAY